jgi:hypothetical protein
MWPLPPSLSAPQPFGFDIFHKVSTSDHQLLSRLLAQQAVSGVPLIPAPVVAHEARDQSGSESGGAEEEQSRRVAVEWIVEKGKEWRRHCTRGMGWALVVAGTEVHV